MSSRRQHDAMSTQQHVPQHVNLPQHVSLLEHVNLPEHDALSAQKHVSFPKHATQLTETTVPVVGTVSRRIDPEQTELEEDSIPRPATHIPRDCKDQEKAVCLFSYFARW